MWRLQHVRVAVHLLSSDVDSRCPPCSFSSRRARCLLSLSLVARSLSMSSRAVLLSGVATISRDFSSIRRSTSDSLDATDKRLWKGSNHMVSAQVLRIFFKESDKIHYYPPGLFILRSNNSILFKDIICISTMIGTFSWLNSKGMTTKLQTVHWLPVIFDDTLFPDITRALSQNETNNTHTLTVLNSERC